MSSTTARVTLRYRPGADVLSGLIHLGDVGATRTDSPDADTSVVWAQVTDGQFVGDHLVSFQIIFAGARLEHGPLPLPAALMPAVRSLITTAQHAAQHANDPLASFRAKAEATTELPLESLRLESLADGATREHGDRRQAAALSHALSQLADAVQRRTPSADEPTALQTDRLSRLLHEVAGSIHRHHGTTAPGTTAATRLALRPLRTLSENQRTGLEAAMDALDHRQRWAEAQSALHRVLTELNDPLPQP